MLTARYIIGIAHQRAGLPKPGVEMNTKVPPLVADPSQTSRDEAAAELDRDDKPKGEYKYGNSAGLEAKLLPGEPWFALRAKDKLSVQAVMAYAELCEKEGLVDHARRVRESADQMLQWQHQNIRHLKLPD